ncbi:BnaC06g05910D [Brassica napus]|uniref:BnaC06g05910D protein n=1 Tax=Brassica napus TaxID=3708 RepID=A0A078GN56_BRANA|nr:BnaC06g05910D [Brassica napus]
MNDKVWLDDWVLCRIYKKQSSAQKQAYEHVVTSTRELSNNGTSSTTSSSSHFEDVLDSLHHETDNRNFQYANSSNRFSSLRPDLTVGEKTGFNGLADTNSFDWGSFVGNVEHNSGPELGLSHVVPSLEFNSGYLKMEEEFNNPDDFGFAQNSYGIDSVGFGYSGQVGGKTLKTILPLEPTLLTASGLHDREEQRRNKNFCAHERDRRNRQHTTRRLWCQHVP